MSPPLRHRATGLAVTAVVVAALMPAAPAGAQAEMMTTGSAGAVSLLTFDGNAEAAPTSRVDIGQASVECDEGARGRRAVFAGALAWAPDETPGLHNDWRYVRVAAGAVDEHGAIRTGEVSPYYAAYDDRAATVPAVGVYLPRSGSYTPVLVVQFFDATYRLTGTRMVASQAGAWRVRLPTPALVNYWGDYWYVAATDLVRCD